MGYQPTEDDYLFIPEEEAVSPAKGGIFEHYVDHWWAVRPEKGLVCYNRKRSSGRREIRYWGSPQCNSNEQITRKSSEGLYPFPVEVRYFSSVWVQISISDYQY